MINKSPSEYTFYAISTFRKQVEAEVIEIFPPSQALLEKSVELANLDTKGQGHISSYDATFHALAILENATFLTADKKHFKKTNKLIGSVELFE